MSGVTTDKNDPRLTHGVDKDPVGQAQVYFVLSPEEIAKGYTRPYRDAYKHVGIAPKHPLRDLTDEEKERHAQWNYVKFEAYPPEMSPVTGRFWTQTQLDARACQTVTTINSREIAATYAREPRTYGSTYCCKCCKHLPVAEFRWLEMDGTLGPVVGS
jgi:hypothetical protein